MSVLPDFFSPEPPVPPVAPDEEPLSDELVELDPLSSDFEGPDDEDEPELEEELLLRLSVL